jgi:hypothetical protein
MKTQLLLIIFCILVIGCETNSNQNKTGEIKVEITDSMLNRMKGGQFYLVEAISKVTIDSVLVDSKLLSFKSFKREKKEPIFLKVMHYDLRNGEKYLLPLGFNQIKLEKQIVHSLFYADETPTYIKAHDFFYNEDSYFIGTKRNTAYFNSFKKG